MNRLTCGAFLEVVNKRTSDVARSVAGLFRYLRDKIIKEERALTQLL